MLPILRTSWFTKNGLSPAIANGLIKILFPNRIK